MTLKIGDFVKVVKTGPNSDMDRSDIGRMGHNIGNGIDGDPNIEIGDERGSIGNENEVVKVKYPKFALVWSNRRDPVEFYATRAKAMIAARRLKRERATYVLLLSGIKVKLLYRST